VSLGSDYVSARIAACLHGWFFGHIFYLESLMDRGWSDFLSDWLAGGDSLQANTPLPYNTTTID